MNPSLIKKIINKKVTSKVIKDHLPVKKGSLPNNSIIPYTCELLLTHNNNRTMKHRQYNRLREREHHPQVGIGLFFILLGAALLVATNDLLNLGSVSRYFTWESALLFIGILLLLNLHFVGGLWLIALGSYFLLDDIFIITPEKVKLFYWPVIIALTGVAFIISSFFKRNRTN